MTSLNVTFPIMKKRDNGVSSLRKVNNRPKQASSSSTSSTTSRSSSFSPPSSIFTQRGRELSRRPSTPPPSATTAAPVVIAPSAVVTPDTSPIPTRSTIPSRPEHNASSPSTRDRILSFPTNVGTPDVTANHKSAVIPANHVLLIRQAFGFHPQNNNHNDDENENQQLRDVDLYADVLQVERSASPKDIRIAYFRRGREVLARAALSSSLSSLPSYKHVRRNNGRSSGAAVSETAKLQFQAVSLAYEILSTPRWKRYYDRHGFPDIIMASGGDASSPQRSKKTTTFRASSVTPPTSAQRSNSKKRPSSDSTTSRLSPRRRSHSVGVRWNDNVEELIYCPQPEEVNLHKQEHGDEDDDEDDEDEEDAMDKHKNKRSKSSKKKLKKRILMETADDDLSIHLRKLDHEAGAFMTELLDQLEASLDEFMNVDGEQPKDATIETDKTDKALVQDDDDEDDDNDDLRNCQVEGVDEEDDESSQGFEVTTHRQPSKPFTTAMKSINSSAVGHFMTDILDQVSSRFEQLLAYDQEEDEGEDKDDTTAEHLTRDENPSPSSPSFFTKLVGAPISQWKQDQHETSELVIGPVAEWGLPASPNVESSRSTAAKVQVPTSRQATTSNSDLVSGPVAEWGRVVSVSPQHPQQVQPPSTLTQGEEQMRIVRPMKMASPSALEKPVAMDMPDDESSTPPPPVREVCNVRPSSHHHYQTQDKDDDVSSMSESYASHRWTRNRAQAREETLQVKAKESSAGLGVVPFQEQQQQQQQQVNAASDYNPTNPFNDDAESIVEGRRDDSFGRHKSSALISPAHTRQDSFFRITVHQNDDDDHCVRCDTDDTFGMICCGDTVELSTITRATKTTSAASTSSSCDSSRRDKPNGVLDFFLFLVNYLEEISSDLVEQGVNAGRRSAKTMMEAVLITEDDLEGMMNILRCEIDKHQG